MENLVWIDGSVPPEELAELIAGAIRRPPPRPWWFYLSLEVKVAAAAVLLALILFGKPTVNLFRHSRTSITSVAATEQAITVHVANSGPKNATIVGQRLKFGTLPIEDAELRLDKSASPTVPPRGGDVKLTAFTLLPKCDADGNRPNNAEIEALLGQHNVTLEIDVRESNDAPGHTTRHIETIRAADLQPFVRKKVPARAPPCD
jgi:hypothetical protein